MIYDHERDGESRRGRQVADWGGDELFSSMPRRRSKYTGARPRRISGPATGSHAARRGDAGEIRHPAAADHQQDAMAGVPLTGSNPAAAATRRFARDPRPDVAGGTSIAVLDEPSSTYPPESPTSDTRRFSRPAPAADRFAPAAPAADRFAPAAPAADRFAAPTAPAADRFAAPAAPAANRFAPAAPAAERFEPGSPAPDGSEPPARRTVKVTGRPEPLPFATARRRPQPTMQERLISGRPDKIAGWAFGLGIMLILIALGTADGGVI